MGHDFRKYYYILKPHLGYEHFGLGCLNTVFKRL